MLGNTLILISRRQWRAFFDKLSIGHAWVINIVDEGSKNEGKLRQRIHLYSRGIIIAGGESFEELLCGHGNMTRVFKVVERICLVAVRNGPNVALKWRLDSIFEMNIFSMIHWTLSTVA